MKTIKLSQYGIVISQDKVNAIHEEMRAGVGEPITLDFKDVKGIDSAAAHELIKSMRGHKGALVQMKNASPMVKSVMMYSSGATVSSGKARKRFLGLIMLAAMLMLGVGQAWAVKSTFTKGETIFIYREGDNSAWRENACVKAYFNDGNGSGSAEYTNWLCNSTSNAKYQVYYTIVPSTGYDRVQIERWPTTCTGSKWNDEWTSLQSNRSSDAYNVLYSAAYNNNGWKNETFNFVLKTDVNSWGDAVATFEDKGDGLFQCTYTFTASAAQHYFVVYDCWGHRYGRLADNNNFYLGGLKSSSSYTVVASFKIQDCDANNQKTSLSVMTIHEPGMYVSASGYNKTLATRASDNLKYETYGISKVKYNNTSSTIVLTAAEQVSNSTEYKDKSNLVYVFSSGENFLSAKQWFGSTKYNSTGSATGINKDEFTAHMGSSAQEIKNQAGQEIILCIKGYNQFSMIAKDNDVSSKYFKVEVDGVDVTKDKNKSAATIRRYDISADTHIIRVSGVGGTNSEFWGFSLRPAAPSITASSLSGAEYAQGASATPLSVTVSPVVAGHTPTYQWYKNATNKNTGGTIIGEATSASYTPPTTTTGTTYYYCVVSETGCNSTTSSVSGAITVTAAAPSCSAPTSPSISGTTAYTAGNTISLTASATGTSGSTTYTWYKGTDWATASASSSVGSGATFTKASCAVGDAGTYWCNISNGTGCEVQVSKAITVSAAPTVGTFSPASGSTVKSGTTVTVAGSTGSTVYYQWSSSSSAPAAATIVDSGTAGTSGAATVTTSGIASSATYLYVVASNGGVNSAVSSASYTIDDTAPTLSSSVPANSATNVNTSGTIVLTFSEAIASVDETKFTLTNATKGAVAIDGSDNTKVNIAYSGASNSTTVTLATTAGAVTDAVGNSSAALGSISFTTKAAATLTAISAGVVYDAEEMIPYGQTVTNEDVIFNDESYSTGNLFYTKAGAEGPKANTKNKPDETIGEGEDYEASFNTNMMYIKGTATLSGTPKTPSAPSIKFKIPAGGGTLYLYGPSNTTAKFIKEGDTDGTAIANSNKYISVSVSGGDICYIYGSSTSTSGFYGLKLVATVPCTAAPTVTAGSNSSVTSTTATVSCESGISSLGTGGCTIIEYGLVIGESANPEIGGSGVTKHVVGTTYTTTGTSFSKDLTGLTASTTYYVRPYATNGYGTGYGTQTSFTTTAAATYTVTYNAQGGSVTPTSETVSTATLPTPTKSGYRFDGWYTSGGSKITGTYNPTADITLYAQWQEICVGSGEKDTIKIGVSSSTSYAASFTSSHKSTHTTASATAFTTGSSTTTSNSTYDKATAPYSVKFKPSSNIYTDEWSDNYSVSASFSVASGYTFTPTRISATIVTEAADYTYRALLTDGVTTYTSSDVSSSANGKFTFSFSSLSGTALSGTIMFKVQYKSTAKNAKYFVFNLPIEIDGIVTASGGGGGASCYYVTYNGNGATGGYTTDEAAYASGDKATAATNSFTKTGYTFGGWATSQANADAGTKDYDEGDAITISGNTTLYAIWQAAGYTLAWNTNGGSALSGTYSSGILADGVAITAPTDPTLSEYTFNSWNTAGDGTGSAYTGTMPAANTIYYAVWAQTVTLDANTANHGSLAGSATAILGRAGLTGITHATPASGYKLTGYYTAATEGTKVLNSDGTFASSNVTDYITSGKWSRTGAAPTLYAQYEASGSLKWNLGVKTTAESLTTSSKESSFTEISTSNMSNATVYGVTYTPSSKNNLTGLISTPASYDADEYVYVTFQVASGYKFTPSSVKVKAQPASTAKSVKLVLSDANSHSQEFTTASTLSEGNIHDVIMTGDGTAYAGIVTLKIYCYGATDSYRLGTPIQIDGAVEATCEMPSFTGLDYIQSSYTVGEDASAISIEGGENITTYAWKQNTTNDRSGITPASGTNDAASYTPPTGAAGTMYYWCEMTNACGTVKTPAVGITVSSSKSDATISWTGTSASANYGGGGYTVKATVNQSAWNGNAEDLTLSAPAGIRIYNIESGTAGSQKYVQASFDVTTAFDRETYSTTIPFTVSADTTTTYNAISDEHAVDFDACSGGEEGSAAIALTSAIHDEGSGNAPRYWFETIGVGRVFGLNYGKATLGTSSDATFSSDGYGYVASSTSQRWVFQPYVEGVTKIRIYIKSATNKLRVLSIGKNASWQDQSSKYSNIAVDTIIYSNDKTTGLDNTEKGYAEIQFSSALTKDNYYMFTMSSSSTYIYGVTLYSGSVGDGGNLATSLTFANTGPIAADASTANFQNIASKSGENSNTLGTITYSSNNDAATVNATTGEVSIHAKEAARVVTITATLSASGCYQGATATYTINVAADVCGEPSGSIELTGSATKCSDESVTLTMTGFTSGATVEWYNGNTKVNGVSGYTIETSGSTSTLTTKAAGTYSAIATSSCAAKRTNSITISNISVDASATKIVDKWYVKKGRLTPDIALWQLGEGETFKSVEWSSSNGTGLDFRTDTETGIVYLEGKEPSTNTSGADIPYTLTLTITDACGTDHELEEQTITLTHQKNTDKHVLAFVVNGTAKGGFTEGITAAQTTGVSLYNTIAAQFDVQATNIYSTDDEKKLKEYYSQYDILCITDYPNTKTKGVNSKSYVDAIGALIDIRPILTMEAFVSALPNWKLKGVSGNPKSPTTRQYTMDLQCKDHEIFAGTDLTKVGEGDEAMYRVSMVDKTKEEYATLDATYGDGAHADKSGYEYASKPALQGFTFTEEMANDLLPIGLIDDGARNPLQVGIERQHNMEARLMVLGINSYAMERLTDDGERVVINALNYLMKKNQEDIADCSTAFVGGAEGDTKNWGNADNWTGNTVPLSTQKVRILADCEVSSTVYAQSVLIVTDGEYNHGSDNAAGKLTIKENGALIVSGKIQEASAPAYNRPRATTPDKLLIETSDEHQAALIFDNEEGETQATVHLYSLGRKPSSYQYQYFAVPMEVVPVNPTFANETHGGTGIYTYVYNEATSGWTRRGYYDDLYAFEGLGITTKSETAMNYTMTGNLASTATKEITLTKNGRGLNLIGNSWMAPIQIGALAEDNTDANITKTVYIYCAGRDAVEGAQEGDAATETAGQWIPIPFEASGTAGWRDAGKLSVIPAMQAFEIKTAAEATLTLDYKKVVRGSTNDLNAKLRAPGRRMAANEVTMTNIRVADSKTHTDLSLFEGDRFSEAFDNGWEAEYMNGDGRSAKLYAETETGKMAVVAMEDYEGTVVGFAPGKETEYTFSFMGEDNGYYLNDIKLKNSVRISEGETYTFTYEEGDAANRFYISRQPLGGPAITTGVDEVREEAKPRKFIYNDKMYILFNGRVFDATGKAVK